MLEKVELIAKEACQKCGVGLYDIELINTQHGRILCVYITKIGGVSINDCTNVTRALNLQLDNDDTLINGSYTLEVSSPGIERPLKLKKHYMSAINEFVKLSIQQDNKRETITGVLKEVNDNYIVVNIDNEEANIEFQSIKKAKTIIPKAVFGNRGSVFGDKHNDTQADITNRVGSSSPENRKPKTEHRNHKEQKK